MTGDEKSRKASVRPAYLVIPAHLVELQAARPSAALAAGLSPKGAKTLCTILVASRRVFIRDGHAGLSMRKVAEESGVALGNINYYFESKRALLEATLREALADYIEAHLEQLEAGAETPLDLLLNIVGFYVSNGRQSHPLFFQIWGFAACDPHAKELVRELYRPVGRLIYYLVRAVRPEASDARVREIVLHLFSLEEGMKLFIGMGPDDDETLRNAERHARTLARRIILAD